MGHFEQELIASPLLPQLDFGEDDAGARNLLGWRDDICSAGDDLLRLLIHGPAIENNPVRFFDLVPHLHRNGDRVAEADGSLEMQRLVDIDGPWTGELRSEHRGDQRAAPHAVRHDLVERITFRERVIQMRRVDIPRHNCEQLDVLVGERSNEARCVSQLDLVESPVFDTFHSTAPNSLINRRCDSRCRHIQYSR